MLNIISKKCIFTEDNLGFLKQSLIKLLFLRESNLLLVSVSSVSSIMLSHLILFICFFESITKFVSFHLLYTS